MSESLKTKLLKVAPESLVNLLIELAGDDEVSWSKIERLVSRPQDNSSRFKKRLAQLKNRGGYIPWKYASKFSEELVDLLSDLKEGASSPEQGYELICDFYRSDAEIFEQSDDSSGHIGDVFRSDAIDLYVEYASKHSDREYVLKTTVELLEGNNYGARDEIVAQARKFLDEVELRRLLSIFDEKNKNETKKFSSWNWKMKLVAKQLRDASLFEKLTYQQVSEPGPKMLVEVAEVYFLSGNSTKAQELLNSIKGKDPFLRHEIEDLQKKIYVSEGKSENLFKLVYSAFQRHFSEYTLKDLIKVAGESRRDQFITEATEKISADQKWDSGHAEFLKYIEDVDNLEKYVLKHREEIDGYNYYSINGLAEFFEKKKRLLPAIILYRALIEATLSKAISKYYHHAVNYLQHLDKISLKVSSWNGVEDHKTYFDNLKIAHRLKKSFWTRYQEN